MSGRRTALVVGAACLAAWLAAACGGGSAGHPPPPPGQNFGAADLERFLLVSSDVPSGYKAKIRVPRGTVDKCLRNAKTSDEQAFINKIRGLGASVCGSSVYERKDKDSTLQIADAAFLFADPGAATKAVPVFTQFFASDASRSATAHPIPAPGLGDQAEGQRLDFGDPSILHSAVYVWRARNVVAFLSGSYVDVSLDNGGEKDILRIAQTVDYRATGHEQRTTTTSPPPPTTTSRPPTTAGRAVTTLPPPGPVTTARPPSTMPTPSGPGPSSDPYESCRRSGASEQFCAPFRH